MMLKRSLRIRGVHSEGSSLKKSWSSSDAAARNTKVVVGPPVPAEPEAAFPAGTEPIPDRQRRLPFRRVRMEVRLAKASEFFCPLSAGTPLIRACQDGSPVSNMISPRSACPITGSRRYWPRDHAGRPSTEREPAGAFLALVTWFVNSAETTSSEVPFADCVNADMLRDCARAVF
jgi:hypothetical protein